MRILITNDDGLHAPGLQALKRGLADATNGLVGPDDIVVVAPHRERSASSCSLTLHKPMRLHEIEPQSYTLTGTPSDCVFFALSYFDQKPFDLVLSGINCGSNMGVGILSSGTVGGAIQAHFRGLPAMAISLYYSGKPPRQVEDYTTSVEVVGSWVKLLAEKKDNVLLNINIPQDLQANQNGGFPQKISVLGPPQYTSDVQERQDPIGRTYYWNAGQRRELQNQGVDNSDAQAVADGYVAVTPISLDLNDHQLCASMQDWLS